MTSDQIMKMVNLGLNPEQIAGMVKMFEEVNAQEEERKQKDRDRKRLERKNKKTLKDSPIKDENVPGQSKDSPDLSDVPPPPSFPPDPLSSAPPPGHTHPRTYEAPCTEEEAWRYANGGMMSISREGVSLWFARCESNGWTTVRANGAIIEQIRDWKANLRASIPWITEQLAKTKTAVSRQKVAESTIGKSSNLSFFP